MSVRERSRDGDIAYTRGCGCVWYMPIPHSIPISLPKQEAVEAYMVKLFDEANLCAIHAHRATVMIK